MVTTDVREKQSMGTSRGSFLSWRLTHSGLYWLRDECFLCFHVGPRRRVVLNTLQGSGVHRGEDTVHTINTPALSWITAMSANKQVCLSSRAPAQKGQLLRPEVSLPLKSLWLNTANKQVCCFHFGSGAQDEFPEQRKEQKEANLRLSHSYGDSHRSQSVFKATIPRQLREGLLNCVINKSFLYSVF